MDKKSFAQLKRDLKVGTKVKTIANHIKPERNGEVRTIGKVQTNAVAFNMENGKLSWLWWDGAHTIEYVGNVFKVFDRESQYNDFTRPLLFEYEILN